MNTKIGINSPQIKDFGGAIDPCEVDIIELGLDRMDFLDEQKEKELLSKTAYLASSFGTEFTIHAPHIDSRIERLKIDFSTNNEKIFTVMEKVFIIAAEIGAEYIVVHPGSQNGGRKCLNLNILNLIHICGLAEEYGVILLLENLFDRNGGNKVGVFPGEIFHMIEMVDSEHLKINLDIGHAFIASNAYGLSLEDYFELGGYIHQMHLHDNFGILESEEAMFGDRHLPLGLGKINFREVFKNILKTNARNLILEIKNSPREYTLTSLTQIREFCSLRFGLKPPAITYSIEPAIACIQ
ncbi:MAG: sugar phosphate isomerase/epimerase [Candidatus Methanoperedens sp.]|nr:sugar phosphate isomerase/epimerase [Candidatus Methanoperedens sp.]MCZ7369557.1 sugar phosphate isomerase/epimerase [Candidatus Methanoperedens sp.]